MTSETKVRFMRQSGIIKPEIQEQPITIIGCGAVGSFTALTLAKMGFHKLSVFDADGIEEHNIPNQFYPLSLVGKNKAEALGEMIKSFEDVNIVAVPKAWKDQMLSGVVISAVDSMKVRQEIWDAVRRNLGVPLFIDGRMGGNQLEVYTVKIDTPNDRVRYGKTLWSDEETSPIACTERTVLYNVLNISSWIANQLRLVLSGKEYKRQIIMDLENMMLILPEEEEKEG